MPIRVFGAGVGRTGTMTLKLALEHLGLGPCHHMIEVLADQPRQVPLWQAAIDGQPDWDAIYTGYSSAVDWPTAGFFRELHAAYPAARVILTLRSATSWVESFGETIYKALAGRDHAPAAVQPWLKMATGVIFRTGFADGMDKAELMATFEAHAAAVRAAIPADQLLVYEVKDGWGPLCAFLGVPVPSAPFPKTNSREEFWAHIAGAS